MESPSSTHARTCIQIRARRLSDAERGARTGTRGDEALAPNGNSDGGVRLWSTFGDCSTASRRECDTRKRKRRNNEWQSDGRCGTTRRTAGEGTWGKGQRKQSHGRVGHRPGGHSCSGGNLEKFARLARGKTEKETGDIRSSWQRPLRSSADVRNRSLVRRKRARRVGGAKGAEGATEAKGGKAECALSSERRADSGERLKPGANTF